MLWEMLTLGVSKCCEQGKLLAQECHDFSRQQIWNTSLLLDVLAVWVLRVNVLERGASHLTRSSP